MREIKFRAWDIENNRWFMKDMFGFSITSDGTRLKYSHPAGHGDYHGSKLVESVVLEQYTGLKDHEGNEIWEGDVLQDTEEYSIAEVTQDKTGAWVWDGEHVVDFIHMLKVIGNVHEDKDLLKR